jgi:exodeoxyribonuclease III
MPGKNLIQNWWRNKKLFRQTKVKRIQYHQTRFTTNVKWTYTIKKYKRRKKDLQNQPQTIQKMAIGTYISIITLNVNGLNAPTKRHRLAEWIQKQDPYICCLQETHFRPKDTYRLKVRGWKNIFHANGKQKKAGVAILISDKIDLKIKKITRDKEGHYIMIKGSIQEEDITIVNIYAPNIGAPQYIRQTLTDIKGEIDSNTIIVGDFNTPLTPMDRSSKQKINKETQVLNDTLDEMDLIDIFRTFHPNAEEYTFFSSAHGTFSRIDHILGHKSNLSKFKKTEIISSIFSDHNAMRLDINYKKKL